MLGAIVGDTVGSIYEFNNTKDYNFEMFTDRSGYTDDSIMTMDGSLVAKKLFLKQSLPFWRAVVSRMLFVRQYQWVATLILLHV